MRKWKFYYYNKRVYEQVYALPDGILGSYISIADMMEIKGPNIGMPHTKAMGEKLFEIRASGKEGIARIFYCTIKQQEIWVLHSFIKKTQETPKKELKIARKRLKEVLDND